MEPTQVRIDALVWKLAAAGYGTRELNRRALAFSRISRDLVFLEVTAADYKAAVAQMKASGDALAGHFHGGPQGTRKMTPAEADLLDDHHRHVGVVFLRIDTLYFVGQRLLDGVVAAADAILSPDKGRPRGLKNLERHRKVKARLEERIEGGIAPPASADLFSLIDEVTRQIKDYRDDYVAHDPPPAFPESRPIVTIAPDRHVIGEEAPGSQETESVTDLLVRYVNAWLDYLETVQLPFEWPTTGTAS